MKGAARKGWARAQSRPQLAKNSLCSEAVLQKPYVETSLQQRYRAFLQHALSWAILLQTVPDIKERKHFWPYTPKVTVNSKECTWISEEVCHWHKFNSEFLPHCLQFKQGIISSNWPTKKGGRGMLASVHPHTPEPPHYKNHPCSYSLHQPHGLAEQRHKAGTAVPEAHKPCFKSVRAVSRQRLCMPPHTRCCSPAEHQRNSQSSMTVRQTDGQQHLILLPF